MADAYQVWAEAAGLSKQKSIRTIFPALAEALDRGTGGGLVDGEGEQQPLCARCATAPATASLGVLAVAKLPDGTAICGYCIGRLPRDGERLARVPGWKAGRRRG